MQSHAICHQRGAALAVFPELGISGYAISDLLQQSTLLHAVEEAISPRSLQPHADLLPLLLVGAPLRHAGALYNTAVAIHRGRLLGVVPKVHLPNYREFYEPRHFSWATEWWAARLPSAHQPHRSAPICCSPPTTAGFVVHAEICEDIWIPVPPSSAGRARWRHRSRQSFGKQHHDRQGRDAPSAVPLAVRPLPRRLSLRGGRRGRINHRSRLGRTGLDFENGATLAETERFPPVSQFALADIDLDLLCHERMQNGQLR